MGSAMKSAQEQLSVIKRGADEVLVEARVPKLGASTGWAFTPGLSDSCGTLS